MKKVTAALLVKEKKILIAKRKIGDKLENKWEFPGGKLEAGETPEECLKRELKEEFDIESIIGDFFGESIYHCKDYSIHLLVYWASLQTSKITLLVHDDFRWETLEGLKNYDFAPADIPIVKKLIDNNIKLKEK